MITATEFLIDNTNIIEHLSERIAQEEKKIAKKCENNKIFEKKRLITKRIITEATKVFERDELDEKDIWTDRENFVLTDEFLMGYISYLNGQLYRARQLYLTDPYDEIDWKDVSKIPQFFRLLEAQNQTLPEKELTERESVIESFGFRETLLDLSEDNPTIYILWREFLKKYYENPITPQFYIENAVDNLGQTYKEFEAVYPKCIVDGRLAIGKEDLVDKEKLNDKDCYAFLIVASNILSIIYDEMEKIYTGKQAYAYFVEHRNDLISKLRFFDWVPYNENENDVEIEDDIEILDYDVTVDDPTVIKLIIIQHFMNSFFYNFCLLTGINRKERVG